MFTVSFYSLYIKILFPSKGLHNSDIAACVLLPVYVVMYT